MVPGDTCWYLVLGGTACYQAMERMILLLVFNSISVKMSFGKMKFGKIDLMDLHIHLPV